MSVYPVIMCGGSGTRLWPASRSDRPKQFVPLVGPRSSFQETVLRLEGLAGAKPPIIVAGVGHQRAIEAQLAELGREAVLLLEPEARDSAAAMAAAAAWIEAHDPGSVAVIVSVDHHVPDAATFRAAADIAAEGARTGHIVTLGVRPAAASTAFGYIRAGEAAGPVKPVAAFVEKPDAATAQTYVDAGYLWNSGNFVTLASTLLAELDAYAPDVAAAARRGVAEGAVDGPSLLLGPAFRTATKISIDFAVMEKTAHAAVLPVDFAWSDVGSWDAVWAASDKDADGNSLVGQPMLSGTSNSLIRVTGGRAVVVMGGRNLAVVVEDDAVLICDLGHSQGVKAAGERFRGVGAGPRFPDLAQAADWYRGWLRSAALPLWWSIGADHADGGFLETLTVAGEPAPAPRRARVQARQAYVYASAGASGWMGPWRQAAWHGLDYLFARYDRGGRLAGMVTQDGAPLDDTPAIYDHAFAMMAMATLNQADPGVRDLAGEAHRIRDGLADRRHAKGGYREWGPHTFQANCNMHMLEASLAWEAAGEADWAPLSDELAELAMSRFIDPEGGFLREFFDADWRPASGDDGRLVEPGHQFEWAWLLARWGKARGREDAVAAARRLFACGLGGVDPVRGVAVNALWDDLSVLDNGARLWPQTEWLKAALILGDEPQALAAANALARYLETPARGAWRDKIRGDGGFVDEPAPASSFYHIACACLELFRAVQKP